MKLSFTFMFLAIGLAFAASAVLGLEPSDLSLAGLPSEEYGSLPAFTVYQEH